MSERVGVTVPTPGGTEQKANVLLEGGPRTLRPNGLAVLELVSHLLRDNSSAPSSAKLRYTLQLGMVLERGHALA